MVQNDNRKNFGLGQKCHQNAPKSNLTSLLYALSKGYTMQ